MEAKILDIIVQGGAVGLCVALIFYSYQKDKMYNKSINNHLEHDELAKKEVAQSNEKVAASNIELARALTLLSERVNRN